MIEKKLLDTLKNLGFHNIILDNCSFSYDDQNNQYISINPYILLTNITYPKGTFRENHTHPEIRITFIRSGIVLIKSQNNDVKLGKGDYIITMPDIIHSLEVLGDEPLSICELVIDAGLK